uniref:Uncharacterized protein n=1 Tax=Oryza barthii TaxID=65489 RepID=A0A0D3EIR9_9ORYZ
MAGAVKRMVDNSYHDVMESIQAEESAAESARNRLLAVSTLLEQQRGALEVVSGRMASWAIREVEMSAITAELLLLDDAAAGAGDAAARMRGIKTTLELVKLIKAEDVTLTLATDDLEHYALKQPGDATFAPAPSPEELDEAMKHAEAAQEHVLRCCARVRAVVRCFQGVERVGVAGAEQGGVIAEGELGVAHESLDAAVRELLKAEAAAAASTANARNVSARKQNATVPDPPIPGGAAMALKSSSTMELVSRMSKSMSVANNILAVHVPRLHALRAALDGIQDEPSRADLASSSAATDACRLIRDTAAGLTHATIHLHNAAYYLSSVLRIALRHADADASTDFSSKLPSLAANPFPRLAAHLLASIPTPPPQPTACTLDDALLAVSVVHNTLALLLDYNLERCILYLRLLGRRNDPNLHRHNRLPLARDRLRAACVMLDFAAAYCNVAANAINAHYIKLQNEASLIFGTAGSRRGRRIDRRIIN